MEEEESKTSDRSVLTFSTPATDLPTTLTMSASSTGERVGCNVLGVGVGLCVSV